MMLAKRFMTDKEFLHPIHKNVEKLVYFYASVI